VKSRRVVATVVALGLAVTGPACAKKDADKLNLLRLVQNTGHTAGVYRYVDSTPPSAFVGAEASNVQVRGLIEDDFRYKARLTVDGNDVLDEVVNDDALAVRFLDPTQIPKFTSGAANTEVLAALAARYWVADDTGAPSLGDAAVSDRLIGLDPIVDSLTVIDYVENAVAAAPKVQKWNPELLDYRPAEDPFPRPEKGSGVTRWDLVPPDLPHPDAAQTGNGNAAIARSPVFRKMSIYVKGGRILQIREQIAAKFDLLKKLRTYVEQYMKANADKKTQQSVKRQLAAVENDPEQLESILNLAVNQLLVRNGEDPIRFHTMVYEFNPQSRGVQADLPTGSDVRIASLDFFGVNSKAKAIAAARSVGASDVNVRVVTEQSTTTTSTTVAGP
jgi:hypothetical protein